VIGKDPTLYFSAEGGVIPQKDKEALTDGQEERLIDEVRGLSIYTFVMLGLYAGLR